MMAGFFYCVGESGWKFVGGHRRTTPLLRVAPPT
jgi:hypothetical protein